MFGIKKTKVEASDFEAENPRVAAMRKPGFAEFISKFPDRDQVKTDEMIQERLEVFEMKEGLVTSIKEVYDKELAQAAGIEFGPDDLKCIDLYVSETAVKDPKSLIEMNAKIAEYGVYPEQIEDATSKVNAATAGMEGLGLMGKAKMYFGMMANMVNSNWGQKGVDAYAGQKVVNGEGVPDGIEGLKVRFARLKESGQEQADRFQSVKEWKEAELKMLEDNFSALKEGMFAGLSFHGEISRIMKQRVKEMIRGKGGEGSLEELGEAVKAKDEIRNQKALGIDFMTAAGAADLEKGIDKRATLEVRALIDEAFGKLEPLTAEDPYGQLEHELAELLSLEKMGTKDMEKTRETVFQILEEAANTLPRDAAGRTKKVLVLELIHNLKA